MDRTSDFGSDSEGSSPSAVTQNFLFGSFFVFKSVFLGCVAKIFKKI